MPTANERIASLESDTAVVCHTLNGLCKELESDRIERKKRDEKTHDLLHGKDTENPGLIVEVDRLKMFMARVARHVSWFWGLFAAGLAASVGSLVAWGLGLFGGAK